MKEFFTVLGYTFKENSKKKSFIISTIITLLLTVLIVSLPAIMNSFDSNKKNKTDQETKIDETKDKENKGIILFVDSQNVLKGNLNKLSETFTDYEFKDYSSDDIESLKERVKQEKNTALLILDEENGIPTFTYLIKEYGKGLGSSSISDTLKNIFVSDLLKASNVSDEVSLKVQSDISYDVQELGKGKMKGYITSIVISLILFFTIYFYGYGVAMSVASEKTSRVMELLVTSTKPSKIILGKSAAMGLLGLLQMLLLSLTGILTYKLTFPEDFKVFGSQLDFSNFTPFSILMIIVYFILGYSLYAMMNAVAGATVSKAEDVNSAIMPISFISMFAFYFGYFTLSVPNGSIAVAASIVPFSAAFSMPCRLLATDVPAWQLAASLGSLVITIILIAWISIKIYSNAVLHYGKRLKVKDLVKISKNN